MPAPNRPAVPWMLSAMFAIWRARALLVVRKTVRVISDLDCC
jgi:hypothetical protein